MLGRSKIKRLQKEMEELTNSYEKQIFDLKQLIEISKSLNSTLDFNALIQSILYICMGQLKVLKAGIFVRKDIARQHLVLHRNQVGFDIDHSISYMVPEDHPLLHYFQDHFECHTLPELEAAVPEIRSLEALTQLEPCLIIPLRAKNIVNGILVLGDPITETLFSPEERDYALNISILAGIAVHNAFLYEVTTTDMMTRLRLRHYFLDVLSTSMADARRKKHTLSLVMIDIDNFKRLNDTHGHIYGDQVIKRVAELMLDNIRQTDLAARYGGEEFVLVLHDADTDTASAIAERIRIAIEESEVEYEGTILSVTVSMGIAQFNARLDTSPRAFIDRADKALYQAKEGGKNQIRVAAPPVTSV
ncbi:diguanylate cyclase DgcA [Spirochaeta lutea]|uniref:diguanylate cyclase n=1 Tax=Spirochaeta lutea TaxID=1480694 RepID=A0A098R0D4_9SPIO|nr:diguanylate cyclase DgcA [Spirochaeta lutea]KGE73384.1 diguanylate cyclase [Spirochaeta lutea]